MVIEHAAERAAGVADYLTRLGLSFDRLRVYAGDSLPLPDAAFASGWGQIIILSGGPMSPHDLDNYPFLRAEADFLRQALDLKTPILGLCLGHQLLADILGGEVEDGQQEVGWLPVQLNEAGTKDPLFDGVPQEFSPFHYHIEQAVTLPPEATVLASSPLCPVQAFRYGQSPVWGVQFHPEINPQRGETILCSSSRLSLPADEIAPMIERGYQVYGEASERILYNFFRAAFAYYEADADFPPPPLRPLALRGSWRFQASLCGNISPGRASTLCTWLIWMASLRSSLAPTTTASTPWAARAASAGNTAPIAASPPSPLSLPRSWPPPGTATSTR